MGGAKREGGSQPVCFGQRKKGKEEEEEEGSSLGDYSFWAHPSAFPDFCDT